LVLGEDAPNTAPRLALELRQAVRNAEKRVAAALKIPLWLDAAVRTAGQDARTPLFIATSVATRLDDVAAVARRAAPDAIARLGLAIAARLDTAAPAPGDVPEEDARLADTIAAELERAKRPLIVSGAGLGSVAVIEAAANVAYALGKRRGAPADL